MAKCGSSITMAKDSLEKMERCRGRCWRQYKAKVHKLQHITFRASGKAVLQTRTQPCYVALGQYRRLRHPTIPQQHCFQRPFPSQTPAQDTGESGTWDSSSFELSVTPGIFKSQHSTPESLMNQKRQIQVVDLSVTFSPPPLALCPVLHCCMLLFCFTAVLMKGFCVVRCLFRFSSIVS